MSGVPPSLCDVIHACIISPIGNGFRVLRCMRCKILASLYTCVFMLYLIPEAERDPQRSQVTSPGNCPYLLNSEYAKARSGRVMLTRYPRLTTRQCRDTGNGKRDQDYDRNLPSSNEGGGEEPLGRMTVPCVICAENLLSVMFVTERSKPFFRVTLDFAIQAGPHPALIRAVEMRRLPRKASRVRGCGLDTQILKSSV